MSATIGDDRRRKVDQIARAGGRAAIAGFLHQTVAVLGLTAFAYDCPEPLADADDRDAVLALVRSGQTLLEQFDEDALIQPNELTAEGGGVLVQVKFSRQAERAIADAEMKEIVNALRKAARLFKKIGQSIGGYALVTNRPISPTARVLGKRLLADMRIVEISEPELHSALMKYAHSFGAEDEEIREGLGVTLAEALKHPNEPITGMTLIRAFTGFESSRRLIPKMLAPLTSNAVQHFQSHLRLPPVPVSRELLGRLDNLTNTRALIVLQGEGGSGKTVALWQWARRRTAATSSGVDALTELRIASRATATLITDVVCDWCNLPAGHPHRRTDTFDHSWSRLQIANPDAPHPLLCIGLDGMDERVSTVDQRQALTAILDWFWSEDKLALRGKPPRASLVITCRDAVETVSGLLRPDLTGLGDEIPELSVLTVEDFSDDELREAAVAAKGVNDQGVERRILASLTGGIPTKAIGIPSVVGGTEIRTIGEPDATPSIDPDVLAAIKHPVTWYAFTQCSVPDQVAILNRDLNAMLGLAKVLVSRFARKLRDRNPDVVGPRTVDAEHTLRVVATATKAPRDWHKESEWFRACERKGIASDRARLTYTEAESEGLIRVTPDGRWAWRHYFVREYLARQARQGGG